MVEQNGLKKYRFCLLKCCISYLVSWDFDFIGIRFVSSEHAGQRGESFCSMRDISVVEINQAEKSAESLSCQRFFVFPNSCNFIWERVSPVFVDVMTRNVSSDARNVHFFRLILSP